MTDTPDPPNAPTVIPSEVSGQRRIGLYRILQLVGEGGMGEVYEAEQEKPVRRRVALKVIKAGMDSKQVVARFEAERQALAMMDHPAVAKVFDAGITPQGQPYFAMEFIQGTPITEYCDRQRLTTEERIRLFNQVCEGVQHAHQKAVIHRDLKPSNVLVATQNGKRFPKIIDFGVAKATTQKLTERTLFTELGVLIGTPEYMSPEQAEMTGESVDTRTDVYSLGVMLYELLVGALPFDSKELREAGFEGIRRTIREKEPPRPSMRVTALGGKASEGSAKLRRTNLPALKKQLRGDLDWITMKALEKDRTRRYGSPAELAADLERQLRHEPIQARPPSAAYRMAKFVRRNRAGVGVAAAGVLVLIAFAATMTVQAGRIAAERDRANREAESSKQALEFMTGLFEISDPSEARGNSVTARELLDNGSKEIQENLSDQPEIQARLMHTMGNVYLKLGLYPQADALIEQAAATRKRVLGDDHPDTLSSMFALALLYADQGRYDEAEPLYLKTLETQKRVLGDDHPETLSSMFALAGLYAGGQGRYAEAEPLIELVIEAQGRVLGDDHPDTLRSMNGLALVYDHRGRYDKAELLLRKTLEVRKRVLGDDHPETLKSVNNLAVLYDGQGRYDEADPLYLETLEARKRVLGDDHPETLRSMYNLAILYHNEGRHDEAEPIYLEALEAQERILGDDHPHTLLSMSSLAVLYLEHGRHDEAELLFLETLKTQERVLGDDHPNTLESMNSLAVLYNEQGRYDEARELLVRAIAMAGKSKESGHDPNHAILYHSLGEVEMEMGDLQEAERHLRHALEIYEVSRHQFLGLVLYQLAGLSVRQQQASEALGFLNRALQHGYQYADTPLGFVDDPELSSLRGDPEFEAMVAEVKKRGQQQSR